MIILSVDDSAVIRKVIRNAVGVLGHDFLEAENGQVALQLLEKHHPEIKLVLLDWNMPVMDGIATLKAIKSHPQFSAIPVMMVTTEAEKGNIAMAIQAGASNYLMKPFAHEDLLMRIMQTLEP